MTAKYVVSYREILGKDIAYTCQFCTVLVFICVTVLIFHSQEPGKELHNNDCFDQTCDQTVLSCGENRFKEYFGLIAEKLGHKPLEVFQHLKLSYMKPDGSKVCYWNVEFFYQFVLTLFPSTSSLSCALPQRFNILKEMGLKVTHFIYYIQGTKFELRKLDSTLTSLLDSICDRLFNNKEPFLSHCLKKELGKIGRKDLKQNLEEDEINIYTDFSKGLLVKQFMFLIYLFDLELPRIQPETLKSEAFGASNETLQLIPQVKCAQSLQTISQQNNEYDHLAQKLR